MTTTDNETPKKRGRPPKVAAEQTVKPNTEKKKPGRKPRAVAAKPKEEQKKRGKKPMLTEELGKKICQYIASGLTKKGASSAVGMSETTFYACINRAIDDNDAGKTTIYTKFAKSVKEAEAQFKLTHIRNIKNAADSGAWQASAWMLERCYREEYGKSSMDVQVSGKPDGDPVKTESAVTIYLPSNNR